MIYRCGVGRKEVKCDKCGKSIFRDWVSGETYEGLDEHHNPPQFTLKEWKGEFVYLCRKCHRELHDEILILMNKKAGTLKFIKSEFWVMKRMNEQQKEELSQEVYDFTKEWLNGDITTT